MAKKVFFLILVICLLGAASAVLAKDPIRKQIDARVLKDKEVRIVCGTWVSTYHRDPRVFPIEFKGAAHKWQAVKQEPNTPLYKGTYVARFLLETYEDGYRSNGFDIDWGNQTNSDLKPFTAKVSVTITQIVDNKGHESAPIGYNVAEVTKYSGYTDNRMSVGQIFGRRPRGNTGTRVYPQEAERAAIVAAIEEASSGLILPIEVKKASPKKQTTSRDTGESSQSRAEKPEEDVLVAPRPKR